MVDSLEAMIRHLVGLNADIDLIVLGFACHTELALESAWIGVRVGHGAATQGAHHLPNTAHSFTSMRVEVDWALSIVTGVIE